jgi:DNA-binding CsgD family transcriptional regulator
MPPPEYTSAPSASPFTGLAPGFQADAPGWDALKDLLAELAFPAWLEEKSAGVFFANHCEALKELLGDRALADVRTALAEPIRANPLQLRDKRGQVVELSVSAHVVPMLRHRKVVGSTVDLYVVCRPGQEAERDRAVINALLGRLLGSTVHTPLAGLTPQQRLIYRQLLSNHSYKEIAAQIGIAHATVRVQVASMRKRLGPAKIPVLRQD